MSAALKGTNLALRLKNTEPLFSEFFSRLKIGDLRLAVVKEEEEWKLATVGENNYDLKTGLRIWVVWMTS